VCVCVRALDVCLFVCESFRLSYPIESIPVKPCTNWHIVCSFVHKYIQVLNTHTYTILDFLCGNYQPIIF